MAKKTNQSDGQRAQEVRRALRIVIEDILVDELGMDRQAIASSANGLPEDPAQETDAGPEPEPQIEPELIEAPPEEPPAEYSVIGDTRRLTAYVLSTDTMLDEIKVGEAWQDDNGELSGTGMFSVMLFEPLSRDMYRESSIGIDTSPLSILATRAARSPFIRIEWEDLDGQ